MAEIATFGHLFLHSLSFWWVIIPSVFLGMIVGALPGFSAANTIIVLLPLTLAMPVEVGLIFMIAIYCSSHMGAGIPAILVNIPGTAGAAATPLDGYPMAKKGMGQQALASGRSWRILTPAQYHVIAVGKRACVYRARQSGRMLVSVNPHSVELKTQTRLKKSALPR